MKQMISVVTLGVADLGRSQAFYEQGLGWKPFKTGGIVMFRTPTAILSLFPRPDLAKDAHVPAEGSGFRAVSLAYCAQSRDEVHAVMDEASAAGATILKQPQVAFWGGYSGYFADPDDHLWEVAFHPDWEFDQDGRVKGL